MAKIFINYRREDTRSDAARIRDRLVTAFGKTNVFMDVDNLLAGQRFDQELAKALEACDIFLAVIGNRWPDILAARAQTGGRDYVREEIAQALARGIVVIPVLIERVPLPAEDSLPPDLRALVMHQKHDVGHERFGRDVADLIEGIKAARKTMRAGAKGVVSVFQFARAAGVVATVALAGATYAMYSGALPVKPLTSASEPKIKASAASAAAKEKAEAEAEAERAAEADHRAARTAS